MDEIIGLDEIIGELELVGDDDDYMIEGEIIGAEDEIDELLAMVEGDEIGAEDVDDLIGAISRGRRRRRPSRRRRSSGRRPVTRRQLARALRRAQTAPRWAQSPKGGGVAVAQRNPTKGRVLVLGGQAVQGPVAGSLIIRTTAQELARVDRLFVTGIDAGGVAIPQTNFLISDIKVGVKSQFASVDPVPAVLFQPDATGQGYSLQMDTIQPGTDFSVTVANAPAGSTFTFGAMASAVR